MIEEGISKIQELAVEASEVQQFTIGGREYTDRALVPLQEPQLDCEQVTTLTGFVDLVKAHVNQFQDGHVYISVHNPRKAVLANLACDLWGRRTEHILAELPDYGRFSFGQFMEQEPFIIGLQTYFRESPDREELLRITGNIVAEDAKTLVDDGVTQQATARSGASLVAVTTVKRIVELRPWRTFREIEQPASRFLFRLKNNPDRVPSMALFIADGEMWQIEAMQRIKEFIKGRTDIPVVA